MGETGTEPVKKGAWDTPRLACSACSWWAIKSAHAHPAEEQENAILSLFREYLLNYLLENQRERQRKAFHVLVYFLNGPNSQIWACPKQELGTRSPVGSPMWVAVAHVLGPSSAAFSDMWVESWIGNRVAWGLAHTPRQNDSIVTDGPPAYHLLLLFLLCQVFIFCTFKLESLVFCCFSVEENLPLLLWYKTWIITFTILCVSRQLCWCQAHSLLCAITISFSQHLLHLPKPLILPHELQLPVASLLSPWLPHSTCFYDCGYSGQLQMSVNGVSLSCHFQLT